MARQQLTSVVLPYTTLFRSEVVLELEIVEDGTLRHDVFEEGAQGRDVPLAVAQLVDEAVLGLFRGGENARVESTDRGPPSPGWCQDQEGLAHRVHDVLGVGF